MATYDLAEGIAQAMVDYIASAQTAKIAAVDARFATVLGLRDFTVRLGPLYQRAEALDVYPLLYVWPQRIRIEPHNAGLGSAAEMFHTFNYVVVAHQPDAGGETPTETLARALMRYMTAILEMVIESRNGTTRPWEWGTGDAPEVQYQYMPAERTYFGVAGLRIGCQIGEAAT